jgi:hypothetical protein
MSTGQLMIITDNAGMKRLHRAIDARACADLAEICEMAGFLSRAFDWREEAASIAISLAWETDVLPPMFENHAILREAWETTRQVIDEEHAEALQYAAERAHQQKVESHIVAGNWPELGMPTPAEALNTLLAGEELEANGHTAFYDNTDGITWCVNPYGVDGILCNGQPTLQRVISFLKDMARGKEYGPVPY